MSADVKIFKLPETGEVALDHDVVVDATDLQRFIDAGGTIYKRGFGLVVSENGFVEYTTRKDFIATKNTWQGAADHYRSWAGERADEGTGVQLACLVLADYCTHRYLEDHGGPTLDMIMLAESTVGESINDAVIALTKEIAP